MTFEDTMVFNNMTNAIKNLNQSKSICDIIDDLNELILTLKGHNQGIIDEAEIMSPVQIKRQRQNRRRRQRIRP
jgi:hypothetical protein